LAQHSTGLGSASLSASIREGKMAQFKIQMRWTQKGLDEIDDSLAPVTTL
jgi:hypothetical protein